MLNLQSAPIIVSIEGDGGKFISRKNMKEIISKLLKSFAIIGIVYVIGYGLWWASFKYLLKYSNRDPVTISISKTMQDGEIISDRFIKGTSIKHGMTKIFDKKGNLIGITNYNYGVLQEQIYIDPKENAKKI